MQTLHASLRHYAIRGIDSQGNINEEDCSKSVAQIMRDVAKRVMAEKDREYQQKIAKLEEVYRADYHIQGPGPAVRGSPGARTGPRAQSYGGAY